MSGRVLIGGVGYRWMGDMSFGVVATDALAKLDWPSHVEVADLGYGAILVAQDLMYADPQYSRLILIAAVDRGRVPGTLHGYRWSAGQIDPADVQARIAEAGGGVVDIEHLLIITSTFAVLPPDIVVIEFEPVDTTGGEAMSETAMQMLDPLTAMVRNEALRPAESVSTAAVVEQTHQYDAMRRSWSNLPS